jgi:predicted outer membrane repeat protein
VTITNSTFSYNTATYVGGAIYIGGGIVRITNSTLSANTATSSPGGAIYSGGELYISFSTIAENKASNIGGGIVGTTVVFKNSIVANNSPSNCNGGNLADGVNFSTDDTCTGFIQVTSGELKLGPLALNSPGLTETHALLKGSAAIDTVTDFTDLSGNVVNTDQRGISRPQKTAGDAGSYEFVPDPIRGISLF